VLFVVDAHRQLVAPDPRVIRAARSLRDATNETIAIAGSSQLDCGVPPVSLVLNKVDRVSKGQRPLLLKLADEFRSLVPFDDVFWISALRGRLGPYYCRCASIIYYI